MVWFANRLDRSGSIPNDDIIMLIVVMTNTIPTIILLRKSALLCWLLLLMLNLVFTNIVTPKAIYFESRIVQNKKNHFTILYISFQLKIKYRAKRIWIKEHNVYFYKWRTYLYFNLIYNCFLFLQLFQLYIEFLMNF
jgi:hypothetical protein